MGAALSRTRAAALLAITVAALEACSPSASESPKAAEPSATPTSSSATDRTALGGRDIELATRNGRCVLRGVGPDQALVPAPPCRFLRQDGRVQQYAYPQQGIDAVMLVAGTPIDAARKAHLGAAPDAECGSTTQGLIVRGAAVTVSATVSRGGLNCYEQGRDEKDFHAVALDFARDPDAGNVRSR